jgi:predicted O-methyltransferase YrrM
MVRLLKPEHVVETGTHIGVGMAYMGQALKDNHTGHLDTIEFLPEIYYRAIKRREDLKLDDVVDIYLMDAAKFTPVDTRTYKLILLDTEPQTRFAELIKFYDYLQPGGFVFIHDLHQHMHQIDNTEHGFAWPYGKLPKEIIELVRSRKLRPFHFETPRGLTGFYKVAEGDYQW